MKLDPTVKARLKLDLKFYRNCNCGLKLQIAQMTRTMEANTQMINRIILLLKQK